MTSSTGIRFHQDAVTIVRAPLAGDRYGDEARDWGTATEWDVTGCRVVPEMSGEYNVQRDEIVRRWSLFMPLDTDVLASDRVRWNGDEYEINGEVRRWRSVSGNLGHIECDLLRVEG